MTPRVTADKLHLSRDERGVLRRAGIVPSDLTRLGPDDLVAATDDVISLHRAGSLVGLASILAAGVSRSIAVNHLTGQCGVRDRDDLAGRNPDELFNTALDAGPYDNPILHVLLAHAVFLAGTRSPSTSDLDFRTWSVAHWRPDADPMLLYWRHVHGASAVVPVRVRAAHLRIPSIRLDARIAEAPELVWPMHPDDVARVPGGSVYVGHCGWAGRRGATMRVENAEPGASVDVAGETFSVTDVAKGPAPLDAVAAGDEIVIVQRPHWRWKEPGRLQVVLRAVPS